MKQVVPYLFFNGDCSIAMNYYKKCFGGELVLMPYRDAPQNQRFPDMPQDAIMHSNLISKNITLMASDIPKDQVQKGNNIYLSLDCDSMEEIRRLFDALAVNAKIIEPLKDTFWGAHFGMLIDQFGIHWMFNYDKEKA